MKLAKAAGVSLLGIMLLLSIACNTPTYHLSTSVDGQGSIMPSSGDFLENEEVILLAKPAWGCDFDHWEGAASGNDSIVTITMNSDKAVTACFVEPGAIPPTEFETYTDDEYGFSISVPDSWLTTSTEEGSGNEETGILFISTGTCSGSPILRCSCSRGNIWLEPAVVL